MHTQYLNTMQLPEPLLAAPYPDLEETPAVGNLELLADAILPEQFSGPPRGTAHTQGQVALMRAVLDDTISCYQKQFGPHTRRERRLAQEAEAWFLDNNDRWPFSFVNICHALDLEPEYLRRGLKQWRQDPPAAPRTKRRHTIRSHSPLRVAA